MTAGRSATSTATRRWPGGHRRRAPGRCASRGPATRSPGRWRAATRAQFGHKLNAPYVWIPLALRLPPRPASTSGRWRNGPSRPARPAQLRVSQAFFNPAEIGVTVPLDYPPLLYLLGAHALDRLSRRRSRGTAAEGLRPSAPCLAARGRSCSLLGFRVGAQHRRLGRDRRRLRGRDRRRQDHRRRADLRRGLLPRGQPDRRHLRPRQLLRLRPLRGWRCPWSGAWDELPAAHAAAIFFDLATVAGLFVLGGRLRRGRLTRPVDPGATGARRSGVGATRPSRLSPGSPTRTRPSRCSATPTTRCSRPCSSGAWSSSRSPLARGGLLAVAALTKFAPLALVPLYAAGERRSVRAVRSRAATCSAAAGPVLRRLRRRYVRCCSPTPRSTPASPTSTTARSQPARPREPVQHLGPGAEPRVAPDRRSRLAAAAGRSRSPSSPGGARSPRSPRSPRR